MNCEEIHLLDLRLRAEGLTGGRIFVQKSDIRGTLSHVQNLGYRWAVNIQKPSIDLL